MKIFDRFSSNHGVDLFDTGNVPAALKCGCHPSVYDFQRESFCDHALTDGDDVGIVVLFGEACAYGIPADSAADSGHLVGDHGLSVSAAAENNSSISFSLCYSFCGGADKVRVVATCIRVSSKVQHLYAFTQQMSFYGFLVVKPSVIGA